MRAWTRRTTGTSSSRVGRTRGRRCPAAVGHGLADADLSVIEGRRRPSSVPQVVGMRRIETGLMSRGGASSRRRPSADRNVDRSSVTESSMRPFASCIMQSKGLAFWLGVGGATSLTPQQVKALADKIAARLP